MKFMGIMTIIGGGLQALSIVGLLVAWLPIWMGVVLTKAGSKAGEYADKGDCAVARRADRPAQDLLHHLRDHDDCLIRDGASSAASSGPSCSRRA